MSHSDEVTEYERKWGLALKTMNQAQLEGEISQWEALRDEWNGHLIDEKIRIVKSHMKGAK